MLHHLSETWLVSLKSQRPENDINSKEIMVVFSPVILQAAVISAK
jgi:hypothetical protein